MMKTSPKYFISLHFSAGPNSFQNSSYLKFLHCANGFSVKKMICPVADRIEAQQDSFYCMETGISPKTERTREDFMEKKHWVYHVFHK